jgi:hypothetical protein
VDTSRRHLRGGGAVSDGVLEHVEYGHDDDDTAGTA